MITTTLNEILKHKPCGQHIGSGRGWDKGLKYLGKTEPDDEPLSLLTILESNGIKDTLWTLRATDGYEREIKLFACVCTCHSLKYYEKKYKNTAPRIAIETAALYIQGKATRADAADAAIAARAAAVDAAIAARAVVVAAVLTADAADAASVAAVLTADAASVAEREFQRQELILMITQGHEYMKI